MRVADRLRQEIFTGQRTPGARLVETGIARRLDVAQSSVREALHQLEKEGLVRRIPNVGASVTCLNSVQVEQVYCLRAELEGCAVQLIGDKGNPEDIQVLQGRIAECYRAVDDPPLEFMMADLEFHLELWSRTGNEFLVEFLSRIVIPLFAFETRNVVPLLSRGDRLRNVEAHKKVIDLLQAGELVEARRSMAQIIEQFRAQTRDLSKAE